MQRHRTFTRFLVTAGVVASAAGLAGFGSASASPVVSALVASPSSPPTIDVSVAPTSTTVSVALDNQCSNAFNVGQNYAITATSANTGVATVSPGVSGALSCSSVKGSATSATFTLTAVCGGTTTINFLPIAGPKGLQDKVAGTSVSVNVSNTAATTCGGGVTTGTGGERPAAPAVTNAYVNANSTAAGTCKTAFASAKNAWRGALISTIANWMPKPESVKDDTNLYATDADWVNFVEAKVNALCGIV